MNIALDLGASYQRLIELEKTLDVLRNGLVNHEAVKQVKECNSSMHYQYVSLVDRYNAFGGIYGKELQRFKTLLDQSVRLQEEVVNAAYNAYTASIASSPAPSASSVLMNDDNLENHDAVSNENEMEITADYVTTTMSSAPAVDPAINYASSCNGDDAESVREIATKNTWSTNNSNNNNSISNTSTMSSWIRPSPTKRPRPRNNSGNSTAMNQKNRNNNNNNNNNVRPTQKSKVNRPTVSIMAVNNYLSYKYGGKGFDVWKKNGQRPIYQETKLRVERTFGDDDAGKRKLKQFMVKRGGLSADVIKYVNVVNKEEYSYGVVTVCDSQSNIERALDKLNAGRSRRESMAWILYPFHYQSENAVVNRKLFVTGFDILSGNDHKAMTQLFLRFGDLACDITMNKDKNGNPFAVVTYREDRSATACVQCHHNMSTRRMLAFNGTELQIRYYSEQKSKDAKNKNKNNGKNNQKQGRRFRKSN